MTTSFHITTTSQLEDAFLHAGRALADAPFINLAFSTVALECKEYDHTKPKSLPQLALCHIWFKNCANFWYTKDDIAWSNEQADLEGMKRFCKMKCYSETSQRFLIWGLKNPETGAYKQDFSSMSNWKLGDTHYFMEWMIRFWSEHGLVLESKGEFQLLREKQNA